MSADNFDSALKKVLVHEGGYSNAKDDPGGMTMWGITHTDYNAFRRLRGLPPLDVRHMTVNERDAIYRKKYWSGARCDDLPAGVDYCVFDGAVNSGVAQSVKWLQRALGVTADGHIGDRTLLAARNADHHRLIRLICDQRFRFLRMLKTYKTFGNGWTRRVCEVESAAMEMAVDEGSVIASQDQIEAGAKARVADITPPAVSLTTAAGGTAASACGASFVQTIHDLMAPFSDAAGALSALRYALIGCAVLGLGITFYAIWKSNKMAAIS